MPTKREPKPEVVDVASTVVRGVHDTPRPKTAAELAAELRLAEANT